jgi:hypothetical protein
MYAGIIFLSLFLLISGQLPAEPRSARLSERQIALLTDNISFNLRECCDEVKANTLQLLIDLDAMHPEVPLDFALLPVMRLLKQHQDEGMRILAAVALQRIGGERARFAVQRRAEYDGSERVARNCSRIARHWDAASVRPEVLAQL